MILITGGAYQGKTKYIKQHFQFDITDGRYCGFELIKTSKILNNYHLLVKRLIETNQNAEHYTRSLCESNPSCIILLDEIGSGIIPIDKSERTWRETVGRCGCILASNSDTVIRLVCGIPIVIKGKLL